MDKILFEKMFGVSKEHPIFGILAGWLASGLGKLYAGVYAYGVVLMIIRGDSKLLIFLIFPIMTLLTGHTFRQTIKRTRPYDEYPIKPYLPTNNKHYGMPSNHSASAMIIALAILYLNTAWGIVLMSLAIVTGLCRIFAGIHYPFDVCVGWIIALIYGSLMLYILM